MSQTNNTKQAAWVAIGSLCYNFYLNTSFLNKYSFLKTHCNENSFF